MTTNATSTFELSADTLIRRAFQLAGLVPSQAGVEDAKIIALHHWRTSALFSAAERAIFGYIDASAATEHPSQAIHDEVAAHFPPSTVVGINLLTGFYAMTARFLGAMEIETEEPFIGWQLEGS